MGKRYAVIDYETFSEAELSLKKKGPKGGVGGYEYCMHPSTEILCVAWRTGTRQELADSDERDTKIWTPRWPDRRSDLSGFLETLLDPDITLVAHNAFFEQCVTRLVFAVRYMYSMKEKILRATTPDRWYCTIAQAQALALPRGLEDIGRVLKMEIQKDTVGAALLRKWMKPTIKSDGTKVRANDEDEFERLVQYCRTDIASEVELFVTTPMLSEAERRVWCLDQQINMRGFAVDRRLIESAISMGKREADEIHTHVSNITDGLIDSMKSPAQVRKFLEEHGCFLPNLKAPTVEEALDNGLADGVARELLEIRQSAGMNSTAKYDTFERLSRSDGRVRGSISYHGATTGRFAGNGVQPHNLPRPPAWLKDTIFAAEIVAEGDAEMLRLLYGQPIQVLSGCIRNVIVAGPRKVLHVIDWASIEARILFWTTNDKAGLRAYREGRKMYEEMASKIFGVPVEQVIQEYVNGEWFKRFVGKEAVLGSGYQMGAPRFQQACKDKKVEISLELAKTAIDSFRTEHPDVVRFWKEIENAAIKALAYPGNRVTCGKVSFLFPGGRFLFCTLPSGRRIAWCDPVIKYPVNKFGKKQAKIYFWGIDSKTRKWKEQTTYGGKLTENVVQAIARDVLVDAMFRADQGGWEIVMHVHDEVVAEIDEQASRDTHTFGRFEKLMAVTPTWAADCPIAVEGFETKRYRK
jgi:DNA polymerase